MLVIIAPRSAAPPHRPGLPACEPFQAATYSAMFAMAHELAVAYDSPVVPLVNAGGVWQQVGQIPRPRRASATANGGIP